MHLLHLLLGSLSSGDQLYLNPPQYLSGCLPVKSSTLRVLAPFPVTAALRGVVASSVLLMVVANGVSVVTFLPMLASSVLLMMVIFLPMVAVKNVPKGVVKVSSAGEAKAVTALEQGRH